MALKTGLRKKDVVEFKRLMGLGMSAEDISVSMRVELPVVQKWGKSLSKTLAKVSKSVDDSPKKDAKPASSPDPNDNKIGEKLAPKTPALKKGEPGK